MRTQLLGDRVTVAAWGLKLEGAVHNGKIELKRTSKAGSLTEAFQIATTEMARWLEDVYKLNSGELASVLGTAMRYDIAEVVDPYVNVVAKVSKKSLAPIRKAGP